MADTIEHVLMSLNPAGWVKTLGLGPYFAATRSENVVGVQVTKELTRRPTIDVRVVSPLTGGQTTRRFARNATAPHGWEEQT
jgi:hypothetical protein